MKADDKRKAYLRHHGKTINSFWINELAIINFENRVSSRDWNRFNRKSNLENRLKIRLIVSMIRFDDSIFDFRLIESNRIYM